MPEEPRTEGLIGNARSNNQSCPKSPGPWYWTVRLNTGTHYAPPLQWLAWDGTRGFAWVQGGYRNTTDATGAYTFDDHLRDMDGDGLLEVGRGGNEAFRNASRNQPDLLRSMSNGFGGTLTVDYRTVVSGPPGSAIGGNLASPTDGVSRTMLADGMGTPPTQTTYEYQQPYFDPGRRQFIGFGKVTTGGNLASPTDVVARTPRRSSGGGPCDASVVLMVRSQRGGVQPRPRR